MSGRAVFLTAASGVAAGTGALLGGLVAGRIGCVTGAALGGLLTGAFTHLSGNYEQKRIADAGVGLRLPSNMGGGFFP